VSTNDEFTVTIPIPMQSTRARGIHATTYYGPMLRARATEADVALIKEEAAKVGVTYSVFIRWCAVMTARELRRRRTGVTQDVEP
jgi:hypothetical protein